MKNQTPKYDNWLLPLGAITLAMSSVLMVGCSSSSSGGSTTAQLPTVEEPPALEVTGTALKCDTPEVPTSTVAATLEVDPLVGVNSIPSYTVSKDMTNSSELMGNAGNNLKRMYPVVPSQTPDGTMPALEKDGTTPIGDVHPILISYAEQVIGPYALGDGSADIGDPTQVDDMFVSISMDNGLTWKKEKVGETSDKSSITVTWDGLRIPYPGHTHKPTMAVKGDKVLVAWNDKYCPSGNPFDLEQVDGTYPDDLYKVNGAQGSIDYEGVIAPNGKTLYEVPFSCVWTARGVLREDPSVADKFDIEWRQAQQMTTGTRDSNKIWIAAETVGFALSWQEDTEGLRAGKGAGPGEGYSGATTNHGTDIWYTHITMEDFDNVCLDGTTNCDPTDTTAWTDDPVAIAGFATKPKPSHNFAYPVRITNNEVCAPEGDTKLYCTAQYLNPNTEATDDTYARNCIATVDRVTGQASGQTKTVQRCVQDDLDYMTPDSTIAPAAAILDGDTGASRPALKILKTDADEFVSVLVYEETKGLSESDAGEPDQGTDPTIIALEGKSVYFESFLWDQPVTVSAGRVVNPRVPEVTITKDETTNDVIDVSPTGNYIYENARRVVIAGQTDVCDAGDYTFGLLFKQGYETRGGPSDMFIVMNTGFTYDDFEVAPMLDFDGNATDIIVPDATNISSHETLFDTQDPPQVIGSNWDETYLDDQSYDIPDDNTFSPRAFLRGYEIYTGFEFTSNWRQTSNGTRPNNFWVNRYVDDGDGIKWHGPQQVSITRGARVSTLDPRFVRTPEGITVESTAAGADAALIEKDTSNPDVLFMSYGTFDMDTKEELDLYYTRSTDKGKTWEYFLTSDGSRADLTPDTGDLGADNIAGTDDDEISLAKLAHKNSIEKEVQALASPDGTMLFNAWLYESHDEACADAFCGLESEFGVVEYDSPIP